VDDLIEGMVCFMNSRDGLTGPINMGNPGEFTIKDLAELVIKKTKSSSKIVYEKLPVDDPTQRKPDILFAETELKWAPTIPLETGIEKTIDYFQKLII
jgi:UDP-glucuronate decarboxylase